MGYVFPMVIWLATIRKTHPSFFKKVVGETSLMIVKHGKLHVVEDEFMFSIYIRIYTVAEHIANKFRLIPGNIFSS